MGLFGRGKKAVDEGKAAVVTRPEDCVHGVRVPHWDSVADMGHNDRAAYFTCESCHKQMTPDEDAHISMAEAMATPGV